MRPRLFQALLAAVLCLAGLNASAFRVDAGGEARARSSSAGRGNASETLEAELNLEIDSGGMKGRASLDTALAASATSGCSDDWAWREGWLAVNLGPARLTVGRKLAGWGVSDIYPVSDVWSPRNNAYARVPLRKDRKGLDGLFLDVPLGAPWALGLVYSPVSQLSTLPSSVDDFLAGLGSGLKPPLHTTVDRTAVRLTRRGDGLDLSINLFKGGSDTPFFIAHPLQPASLLATRQHGISGDLAIEADGVLYFVEFVRELLRPVGQHGHQADMNQAVIAGLEHQFENDVVAGLQVLSRRSSFDASGTSALDVLSRRVVRGAFENDSTALFVTLSRPLLEGRGRWDLTAGASSHEHSFSAGLEYPLAEGLMLRGRYSDFHGRLGVFGVNRFRNGIVFELAVMF